MPISLASQLVMAWDALGGWLAALRPPFLLACVQTHGYTAYIGPGTVSHHAHLPRNDTHLQGYHLPHFGTPTPMLPDASPDWNNSSV